MAAIKETVSVIEKKKTKPNFFIQTNGLMPQETLEYLLQKRFIISISWDGKGSQNLFRSRLQNKNEIIENIILKLVEKKAHFKVRMTVGKWNIKNILHSIKWLISNGVKFIHLEPLKAAGKGKLLNRQLILPNEFVDIFFKALNLARRRKAYILNYALVNLFSPSDYFCPSAAGEKLHFNPDGSISGCYRIQRKTDSLARFFIVGKYKNTVNLSKIKNLKMKATDYIGCKMCPLLFICSGGCPLEHLEYDAKNTNNLNPLTCHLRKEIITNSILHLYKCSLNKMEHCLDGWAVFEQGL